MDALDKQTRDRLWVKIRQTTKMDLSLIQYDYQYKAIHHSLININEVTT